MAALPGWRVAVLALAATSNDPTSPIRSSRETLAQCVAIAKGESGWDPNAEGDQHLTDATWGPSVGLWQVRTLKAQTGTGAARDIEKLRGDAGAQAAAMVAISGAGTTWQPWSVWTNGDYARHMDDAEDAIRDVEARFGGRFPEDYDMLPGGLAGLALDIDGAVVQPVAGAVGAATSPFAALLDRGLWLRVALVAGGFILLVVGLWFLAQDSIRGAAAQVASAVK